MVALSASLASLAAATGCARSALDTGTTITTGAMGPRVTSARPEQADMSNRIADEICLRETTCGNVGPTDRDRYRTSEACMSDHAARSPAVVSRWVCTPAPQAFEACLAAIRGETCDTQLERADGIAACSSATVCAAP